MQAHGGRIWAESDGPSGGSHDPRLSAVLSQAQDRDGADAICAWTNDPQTLRVSPLRALQGGVTAIEYRMRVKAFGQSGLVADKPPTATTCGGSEEVGDSKPVRNIVKRLRRHLGDDADNLTYIVNEPRVIFRMGKTEEPVQ